MSNRFTKYTADKLRADGWLDKEQADHLRTQLKSVEAERDKWSDSCRKLDQKCERLENQFSALLLRLQAAEWLLDHCPDSLDPNPMVNKQWWSRRDTFLNPKPQDVK